MGWEDEGLIGNAILKFPERHWFVRELCDAAERAGSDVEWGATGPLMLTRIARARGLLANPQATSYPVQSKDALQLLMPEHRQKIRETTMQAPFLHMWNEVMRRAVVFTWMAPPPESFIAGLFERHRIGFGGAPAYTAEQIQRLNENYSTFAFGGEYREQNDLLRSQVDRLHAQLGTKNVESIRLSAKLTSTRQRSDALAQEVAYLRAIMSALQVSTSWCLTAPVRRMTDFLRAWTVRKSST